MLCTTNDLFTVENFIFYLFWLSVISRPIFSFMLKTVLLTLAIFSSTLLFAQTPKTELVSGYIVSAKGDTLFGEINYLKKSGYRQGMIIKLADQTTKNCNARNYVYVKAGEEIFESFLVPAGEVNEKQFFWKKSSGKIDFYEYQYEIFVANNMVTKSEFYIRTKGTEELVKLNGSNFKKKLGELVKDNAKIAERIAAKETKLEDVGEILAEYNKGN